MSTITFDTLKFADRLEKAGATRELAAAMAEAQKESLSEVMDGQLATKSDIAKLESKLESRFVAVDSKMVSIENRLESMELRLTIKLGTFLAAFAGVIIAALKVF